MGMNQRSRRYGNTRSGWLFMPIGCSLRGAMVAMCHCCTVFARGKLVSRFLLLAARPGIPRAKVSVFGNARPALAWIHSSEGQLA